jgi:hypothetical protein
VVEQKELKFLIVAKNVHYFIIICMLQSKIDKDGIFEIN